MCVVRSRDRAVRALKAWPLRWRLVAVLVVLLVTALFLTNLATQLLLRSYLMDRTSDELRSASNSAASNSLPQIMATGHVFTPGLPTTYTVIYMDPKGRSPYLQPSSDEHVLPDIPRLPLDDPRVRSGEPFTTDSIKVDPSSGNTRTDNPQWRVVAGPLSDRSGTYAVATSLRGVDETMSRLHVVSLAIGLLVVAICVHVGFLGVNRAFRPLRQIEDTAAAIADGDLTQRVPEHAAQDEVASLSRSLNTMLSQIENSFAVREASEDRMRRFVTDASHELRTPLATVRGYAELYRQGAASSPEATAGAMRRIEDEATRMSGLVEDLLTLARLDNRRPMTFDEVDLTVLVGDAVQDAKARDPQRPIRLVGLGDGSLGPTMICGDEARLRQVVTNLVANALQHTPSGSPVEVAVGTVGSDATDLPGAGEARRIYRLEVRDHGSGIAEADIDRVFQRFFRGDPSRGRSSGGSGLGLAIVMAIVNAHGGRVGVRATCGGGATFVVEIPSDCRPQASVTSGPEKASTPKVKVSASKLRWARSKRVQDSPVVAAAATPPGLDGQGKHAVAGTVSPSTPPTAVRTDDDHEGVR
ncbi:sensor histidine kinase [Austwickia chelonae]|uniref:sensor histidine kinase n=1 Tax=Austwickia chelonae TaxID=100225 RepID=UPI001F071C9E|nr:HAMP domain-containing sensor histidine kinase [Austwickia chelonae]